TGRRLFQGDDQSALMAAVLDAPVVPPSGIAPRVPGALDGVVLQALSRNAALRYPTARDLAIAVEEALPPATPREVAAWVERLGGEALAARTARIARIERLSVPAASPRSESEILDQETVPEGNLGARSPGARSPGARGSLGRRAVVATAIVGVALGGL